ncbi:MAG: hypothetical protein HUU20_26195 [Pirellulales bacterium]|nr:hypothetical protein [Pirellulales bacterium]
MSRDPHDFDDLETAEYQPSPEEEVAPESAPPAEEIEAEAEPAETAEEEPKKGKKTKKAKKAKKEKKPKAPKEPSEAGGLAKFFGRQFPDVYSVMLMIALLAILVAIAVLAVELSRYGFDIKAPSAMLVW